MQMVEVDGSGFQLKADLVLLAMGFLGPHRNALLEQAGVELDSRGNVAANTVQYLTSRDRLFAAGDMRRGNPWLSGLFARGGNARGRWTSS